MHFSHHISFPQSVLYFSLIHNFNFVCYISNYDFAWSVIFQIPKLCSWIFVLNYSVMYNFFDNFNSLNSAKWNSRVLYGVGLELHVILNVIVLSTMQIWIWLGELLCGVGCSKSRRDDWLNYYVVPVVDSGYKKLHKSIFWKCRRGPLTMWISTRVDVFGFGNVPKTKVLSENLMMG